MLHCEEKDYEDGNASDSCLDWRKQLFEDGVNNWMRQIYIVNIGYWQTLCFFFSSRRRHTRCGRDWSSDVCSSDLPSAKTPVSTSSTAATTNPPSTTKPSPTGTACPRRHSSKPIFSRSATTRARRIITRSEERRVGKECRSRWSLDDEKKKQNKGSE